jgi:hypothetical protein
MVEVFSIAIIFAVLIILVACGFLYWSYNSTSPSTKLEIPSDENFDANNFQNILNTNNDKDILSGKTDKYEWTQNDNEVEVYITVDSNVRAKDVTCKITNEKLMIRINGKDLINGELYDFVVPEECNWQMGIYIYEFFSRI